MKIYEETEKGSDVVVALSLKDCQALVDALDHAINPVKVTQKRAGKVTATEHRVLNRQSNAFKLAKQLHDNLPYAKG